MGRGLHGIDVILYEKNRIGTDDFNRPIYKELPEVVPDVLVGEPTSTEVLDTLNITGKKLVYTLAIPKGDTHDWKDCKVEFFGKKFRTFGEPIEGIEDMMPLRWNKKVQVERYE